MKVITWSTPAGKKINVCEECEAHLAGRWPRDEKTGEEFCEVHVGLHRGLCDICSPDSDIL